MCLLEKLFMKIIKIIGFFLALIGMWTVWVWWKNRSVQVMVTQEVPLEKFIDPEADQKRSS